jgi:hypothetical protein
MLGPDDHAVLVNHMGNRHSAAWQRGVGCGRRGGRRCCSCWCGQCCKGEHGRRR